jgi:hypothetical protein
MRHLLMLALILAPAACAEGPVAPDPGEPEAELRVEFGHWQGIDVVGFGDAPAVDTDELPRYALHAGGRLVAEAALEAVIDADTATLAWVDAAGTLWLAPIETAPDGKRAVGEQVLPALVTARGRLAFAERVDGPETAPFVVDLRTRDRIALDDGPGPDEVLRFSPEADRVLLLSGRTGLASLFVVGVDTPEVRQLTNAGLRPGPTLNPARVIEAPASHRDVTWDRGGVAYRAEAAVIRVALDGTVERLAADVEPAEVVR